ncbi:glycoside hydrolase family 130 protein [Fictibacillus fluitans]|uniref:Glycosidase n=1 Tax=Fictibacillus fluitans TaxID=3058422 RepID=A0ABT8HWM1_9BACL|nr:glycosidase [Fictibacillus sp. NE201]MDN4525177.1 glycosidase [Fictibacillus sp. NE201]
MLLTKHAQNPILKPNPDNDWESLVVCNPGAYYKDGTFYLLYRAAGDDKDHYIYLGLAESNDGVNFTRSSSQPVLSPSSDGPDQGCVEDPRIVEFDDTYYITYAYRPYPPGRYWDFGPDEVQTNNLPESAPYHLKHNVTNTGLLMSDDLKSYKRLGRLTEPSLDDRDVILFPEKINGKYYMLQRPKEWIGEDYGCDYPSIWITSSDDLLQWDEERKLLAKGEVEWELKIGGSTPPLKTEEGWLTLYHGVDDKGVYRVGALLLDLNDPTKIIARPPNYIMEPEHEYEWEGFYKGCVFPTGNVIVDDTLYVYYGGADKYCCLATCSVTELLSFIKKYPVKA